MSLKSPPNPSTMKTPLILLISLTTLYTATGNGGMETHHLHAVIGSSVLFPGVKINNHTVCDLTGPNRAVVVSCHGDCTVRDPYTQRGRFYQHNGTFLLTRLKKEDSGTFEYKVNFTTTIRIYLLVMDPVMDPVLEEEVTENGTQCLVNITCQAQGDGPFNFTILREDLILHNITSKTGSINLPLDGWDPETSGTFSCEVTNLASSKTSPAIVFLLPARPGQMEMVCVVIGLFIQWGVTMLFSLWERCSHKCRKSNSEQFPRKNGNSDEGARGSGGSRLLREALSTADSFLGFIKESLAVTIFLYGYVIPWWCWVVPAFFLLCRTIHWMIRLGNGCRKIRDKISFPFVKDFCALAIFISSVFGVPAFCIAVLVTFYIYYSCPCSCGMTHGCPLYSSAVLIAFVGLCLISYLYLKKAKDKIIQQSQSEDVKTPPAEVQIGSTGLVPIGGNGQPEDNGDLDCKERAPGVVVDIPNGDLANPEKETSCENSTEESPEGHSIPKPKEGQSQGSVEIPCKSRFRAAPNHENSDDTEDPEGQCLLTVATKVVVWEKDRVANG